MHWVQRKLRNHWQHQNGYDPPDYIWPSNGARSRNDSAPWVISDALDPKRTRNNEEEWHMEGVDVIIYQLRRIPIGAAQPTTRHCAPEYVTKNDQPNGIALGRVNPSYSAHRMATLKARAERGA